MKTPTIVAETIQAVRALNIPLRVKENIARDLEADLVIPMLNLNGAEAECIVNSNEVCVTIGPRDWQWDAFTGERLGCGTLLEAA
jgi:hypothetical protein